MTEKTRHAQAERDRERTSDRERQADHVLQIVRERRIVRAREMAQMGISPTHLQRLFERGALARPARGIYTLPHPDLDENQSLSEVALRVPRGVVCLLSALQFHQIGTQSPHQVWLALPTRTYQPTLDWPPLRIVQMAPAMLEDGVEEHRVNGVTVRVTSPARTVVDCFRFRNKIGLDVALEAARDGWRDRRYTMAQIAHYQRLCRVTKIMRPYMEAIVA